MDCGRLQRRCDDTELTWKEGTVEGQKGSNVRGESAWETNGRKGRSEEGSDYGNPFREWGRVPSEGVRHKRTGQEGKTK